jgi:acyl carrier protein
MHDDERVAVLSTLQGFIEELFGNEAPKLTMATAIRESGLDSLDLVEILMMVEEHYAITLPAEETETAADVAGLIDSILAQRLLLGK